MPIEKNGNGLLCVIVCIDAMLPTVRTGELSFHEEIEFVNVF